MKSKCRRTSTETKTIEETKNRNRGETMSGQTKKRSMDMLHGSIWNKHILYALPVAATGILEQLFNASDVAIVGNFTGEMRTVAVAAVVVPHRTCTPGFPRHITHHRRPCTARGCMIRSTTTCGPASRRRAAARPTRGATSNGRLRHQARRHQRHERSR